MIIILISSIITIVITIIIITMPAVDGAIHRAAGSDLSKECALHKGCAVSEVVITGGEFCFFLFISVLFFCVIFQILFSLI